MPVPGSKPQARLRQGNLFGGQKVVPFEALVSTRRQYGRRRDPVRRAEPRPSQRAAQPALELRAPAASVAPAAAYGDASVAGMDLRARAAGLDALICLAGAGVFAATFHFMGGSFVLTRAAMPGWIAAAALLFASYHLFFAAAGCNTAGMRFYRLAVITFDGLAPGPRLRVARFFSAALGAAALGLGLVWALFDEERLAWHDQITRSFPTRLATHPGTLRRQ